MIVKIAKINSSQLQEKLISKALEQLKVHDDIKLDATNVSLVSIMYENEADDTVWYTVVISLLRLKNEVDTTEKKVIEINIKNYYSIFNYTYVDRELRNAFVIVG